MFTYVNRKNKKIPARRLVINSEDFCIGRGNLVDFHGDILYRTYLKQYKRKKKKFPSKKPRTLFYTPSDLTKTNNLLKSKQLVDELFS